MKAKTQYIDVWIDSRGCKNIVQFVRIPNPEQEAPVYVYKNVSAKSMKRLADHINNRVVANVVVASNGWTACISPPQSESHA